MSFTEAPASLNVQVTTPGGFIGQITLRGEDYEELVNSYIQKERQLVALGFTVHVPRSFGGFQKKEEKQKDWVEGRICPLDRGRLYRDKTKNGKEFIKCEHNKWDFQLKKAVGCVFIEWVKPQQPELDTSPF